MSTTWNYRIVRREVGGETTYGIHEAYYEDDDVVAWTVDPVPVTADSLDELRAEVEHIADAVNHPVIEDRASGRDPGTADGA